MHAHVVHVQIYGTWEDDEAIYVVEEYAIMGDALQVRRNG